MEASEVERAAKPEKPSSEEQAEASCSEDAEHAPEGSEVVLMSGTLWKKSVYMKRWNKRYFELTPRSLRYKKTIEEKQYRGNLPIHCMSAVGLLPRLKAHPNWTGFYVHSSDDSVALCCEELEQAQFWVAALERARAEVDGSGLGLEEVVLSPGAGALSPSGEESPAVTPRAAKRPSFSLPSFRPRSRTLAEVVTTADHDEQFSLVSGMMDDITKKKEVEIDELRGRIRELEADLEDSRRQNASLASELDQARADREAIAKQLETRTRLHGDLEIEFLKLKDRAARDRAEVETVQTVLTTPFWSPKRSPKKSPKKKSK